MPVGPGMRVDDRLPRAQSRAGYFRSWRTPDAR